jgi:hypothetical protein
MSTFSSTRALLLAAFSAVWIQQAAAQTPTENGISEQAPSGEAAVTATPSEVEVGGPWLEFSFGAEGSFAQGCAPADPAASGCTPSSAGNSVFGGPPPFTFTLPDGGGVLTVTDAFQNGDEFEVFDFGVSIGRTSSVEIDGSCAPDPTNPDDCSQDPASSSAAFALGAGDHEITIQAIASPFGAGAAYLRADANPTLDHMTCYRIRPEDKDDVRREVILRNQFGEMKARVLRPDLLCLPTEKEVIE